MSALPPKSRFLDLRRPEIREFAKFLVVGGAGTVLNMAVFVLCHRVLGFYHMVAATVAFLCAVSSNYYWNRVWTFKWGGRPDVGVRCYEFVTVSVYALALNLMVLKMMVDFFEFSAELGQLSGIAIGTLFNFAGSKLWVFSERRQRRRQEASTSE